MLSIFVLTYNEERNLPACLASIRGLSDDVHIIDSFSSDRTLEIAKDSAAKIHQRAFDTFARQCNWALDHVPFQHGWVMRLDADERLYPETVLEIQERLAKAKDDLSAIILKKRMYFMGRWIRYGRMYPMLRLCIYRRDVGRYEDLEEEQFVVTYGRTVIAEKDFFENNVNNDLPFFTRKHVDYAEDEVREFLSCTTAGNLKPRVFGNKIERTRWLKLNIYNQAPLGTRALLYFLYRYIFCLGFLDGREGLIFHTLQAFWYRFYVDARIYEVRTRWQDDHTGETE
jgi:glycosyltransferase involved in cell wall biosynthesis